MSPVKALEELVDTLPGVGLVGEDEGLDLGHDSVPGHVLCLVELQGRQDVDVELGVCVNDLESLVQCRRRET